MKYEAKDIKLQLRLLLFKFKGKLELATGLILLALSLVSIFLLIIGIGYELTDYQELNVLHASTVVLFFFFLISTIRFLLNYNEVYKERLLYVDATIYMLSFITICTLLFFPERMQHGFPILDFISNKWMVYTLLAILSIINTSKFVIRSLSAKINPSLLFIYSFLLIILIGTGLLMLPNSHNNELKFVDALFTATTSVCVTGLTTVDISTTYSLTGQIIILILIQVGGIGVMTFTSFFALSFMGKSSFGSSILLKDFLNEENMGNMFRTLVNIIIVTFIIEGIGTWLLFHNLGEIPHRDFSGKLFICIFHSISAFCNAGISTLHGNLGNPLTIYNYPFLFWISILIILGGLGFPIVFNYMKLFRHYVVNVFKLITGKQQHYQHNPWIVHVHTRIVVISTIILLVVGTALIYFGEKDNALAGLSETGKLTSAFFNAVVPRTAGFVAIDITQFAQPTLFIILILMMIGAAPMSTGGGMKVNTVAVAIMATFNTARGKKHLEIKHREIRTSNIAKAYSVIVLYIIWMFFATCILMYTEKNNHLLSVLFEVVSALSTVGSSLNYSPGLSTFGKYVIIFTMFLGRIGVLTFLAGIMKRYEEKNYKFPEAGIIIG